LSENGKRWREKKEKRTEEKAQRNKSGEVSNQRGMSQIRLTERGRGKGEKKEGIRGDLRRVNITDCGVSLKEDASF